MEQRNNIPFKSKFEGALGQKSATWYFIPESHDQSSLDYYSPWHDLPLYGVSLDASTPVYHFIAEIPRGKRAKMEITTDAKHNPIKQSLKKGKLKFYHYDSLVNYGALSQTWENPNVLDPRTGYGGDNDPIDVIEIGQHVAAVGEIYTVKVLGALPMIDHGETDWKLIAIKTTDPFAPKLNCVDDFEKYPETKGLYIKLRTWFRDYKIPDGKPPSKFALNGSSPNIVSAPSS